MPDPINLTQSAEQLDGKTMVTTQDAQTVTGLKTFDRGSGVAPLAVVSGAVVVTNLDADKLDGQHGSYYRDASNLNAGTVPDAQIPNPLPAVSGENLTNLPVQEPIEPINDPLVYGGTLFGFRW